MRAYANETIAAIATPPGQGGVGVVRISGPDARTVLEKLWRGRTPVERFKPRTLYLGEVVDVGSRVTGHVSRLDRVLAVYMPAPQTYTGDDVVELSAHGSPVVLERLLTACCAAGARVAEPGEFTRRAFLAGKLDLVQAEGVADLIAATSERAARVAADQLAGRLSERVMAIGDEIAELRAFVEASIDFPEEDLGTFADESVEARLAGALERTRALSATFREGRLLREGVRAAIVGPANAGKSSLLNRLVGSHRALVHEAPGTTRDVVEESIDIGGTVVRLRDTAGLRATTCAVEAMGTRRARSEIEAADLILLVLDGSRPLDDDDRAALRAAEGRRVITVLNKSDLSREIDIEGATHLSALTGDGIEALCARIAATAEIDSGLADGAVVTNVRHGSALDASAHALAEAIDALRASAPLECIAQHLHAAQSKLGEITGAVTTDDLLDRIFSRFCIGK